MVDFVLNIRIVLVWDLDEWDLRKGLRPQALDTFGLNPHSQLIIVYHWFTFLNQVRKNLNP